MRNGLQVGDSVRWVSGAGAGSNLKEKQGTIIGLIPKNARAFPLLPKGISQGQRKFDTDQNLVSDRVLVEVPRGGKSILKDYYAPQISRVELVDV